MLAKPFPHLHVLVLAAGQGKRMKSDRPKVLHLLEGRPLLAHVLDTAFSLEPAGVVVVVGYRAELVRVAVAAERVTWVDQGKPLGTGHAVLRGLTGVPTTGDPILTLYGDVPLVRAETLQRLLACLRDNPEAVAAIITAHFADPAGYGRIIRDERGELSDIVEEADATPEQRVVREVNIGLGLYRRGPLEEALAELSPQNRQGEYYLTDVVGILRRQGYRVASLPASDPDEFQGVNTPEHLARCTELLRQKTAGERGI
jgi:bifunctional UDP-N-acetylglucosamine pyrophosphorylase / glucosamine-1-phosphate N-acetyltransferase